MKSRFFVLGIFAFALLFISCNSVDANKIDHASPDNEKKNVVKLKGTKKNRASTSKNLKNKKAGTVSLINRANDADNYAAKNGYSTKYCFLMDMSIASGRNRFFVYDLEERAVAYAGLVAHGCCNESFISHPRFSNASGSGCSSLGKYKVGASYHGQWGKSFRLYGLDKSNSNAFKRAVVIHGHDCVEDSEIYPRVLCNSFGCPMVSHKFFKKLSSIIEKSEKPVLLWIYR
jgi:hypothetical protein